MDNWSEAAREAIAQGRRFTDLHTLESAVRRAQYHWDAFKFELAKQVLKHPVFTALWLAGLAVILYFPDS